MDSIMASGSSRQRLFRVSTGGNKPRLTEGNAQLSINLLPQVAARDSAVPSKSPDAPRRSSGAADAANDGEHYQGNQQAKRTAGGSDSGLEDGRDRLAGGEGEQAVDIGQDE